MSIESANQLKTGVPSRLAVLTFNAKVALLRTQRRIENIRTPLPRLLAADRYPCVLAEVRTPLYGDAKLGLNNAERTRELGKVHNLRIIAELLDLARAEAGQTFSFWTHVGKCTKRRGFQLGRQVQEGCLIPAVGGGICQLTNSLYEAALLGGLEIVERHPHTVVVPGSASEHDLDATVAWNHIDLRLRSERSWQISAHLTSTELIVRVLGQAERQNTIRLSPSPKRASIDLNAHSCATCGEQQCFIRERTPGGTASVTAVLVDEVWPEFDAYLGSVQTQRQLFLPLDADRFSRPKYRWSKDGFQEVHYATRVALERSWRQQQLANQGAERQKALLRGSEELAKAYSDRLPIEATHLIVAQNLLPYLWRMGVLGGRTFDVFMSRLPIQTLQSKLDAVFAKHPERRLLGDFRADTWLVTCESEALKAARKLITPHTYIAKSFRNSELIPWAVGKSVSWSPGPRIAFPGPTVSRKGAYEVREAARALNREVVLLGSELEGAEFWDGVQTQRGTTNDWLADVGVVVQPAVIEDRPRRLLEALAAGCPVIATEECGLPEDPLLTLVPTADGEAFTKALQTFFLAEKPNLRDAPTRLP